METTTTTIEDVIKAKLQNKEFIPIDDEDKTAIQAVEASTDEAQQTPDEVEAEAENQIDNKQQFGKFKNPEELLKAYAELEREFTRRSQKLKEMESERAEAPQDWKVAVDKFFEKTPAAKTFARDIAQEILDDPELKKDKNCLDLALTRVLLKNFRTPEQLMSDGQFLETYVLSSKQVRDAVIADYLDGLKKGQPPYTMSGAGMQCVAPKNKPKTLQEAGLMFLKNNK